MEPDGAREEAYAAGRASALARRTAERLLAQSNTERYEGIVESALREARADALREVMGLLERRVERLYGEPAVQGSSHQICVGAATSEARGILAAVRALLGEGKCDDPG